MALRLALLPLLMPPLLAYHIIESMWNGPHATGYWWKCGEFIMGVERHEMSKQR